MDYSISNTLERREMAECEWAIISDYGFMDVNRKMCFIGIFDRVMAKSVPTQRQLCATVRLIGDPREQVGIKIELVRPAGGVLANLEGQTILSETGAGEFQ